MISSYVSHLSHFVFKLQNGTVRDAIGFLFHFTQFRVKIPSWFLSEELYQVSTHTL